MMLLSFCPIAGLSQFKLLSVILNFRFSLAFVPSQLMRCVGKRQAVRLIRSLKMASVPVMIIYAMLLISFNAKLNLKQEATV